MKSFFVVVVALCLAAANWALPAQAQPGDYRALVDRAVADYAGGRYAEALAGFERAHALSPNARTHRGIGISAQQLGRYTLARQHLRQALADDRQPLAGALRERTRRALELAEAPIARLRLLLDAQAAVFVDGEPATLDTDAGELLLDPGSHTIQARTPQQDGEPHELVLQAGQRAELDLRLPSTPTPTPLPAVATAPLIGPTSAPTSNDTASVTAVAEASGPSRLGPILLLGVGASALVSAAVTGAIGVADQNALEDGCPADRMDCAAGLESRFDRAGHMQLATNVLLGAGATLVGAGLLWWLFTPTGETSSLSASLGVAPGAMQLHMWGRL